MRQRTIRAFVAAVALAAVSAGVRAQEPTAPVWPTPDRFWFRVAEPGGHEWWTVDAPHGNRERLFDHRRLAVELSAQSKREFTALTLRFASNDAAFAVKYDGTNAALQEGALAIEFSLENERWRCELQGEWDWGRTPPSDYYCAELDKWTQPPAASTAVRSPDGKWEALVENNNVGVRPVGDTLRMLSTDGSAAAPYHLGSLRWSADGRSLGGYRVHSDSWRTPAAGSVRNLVVKRDWVVAN